MRAQQNSGTHYSDTFFSIVKQLWSDWVRNILVTYALLTSFKLLLHEQDHAIFPESRRQMWATNFEVSRYQIQSQSMEISNVSWGSIPPDPLYMWATTDYDPDTQ